jgi:hypothetical protein
MKTKFLLFIVVFATAAVAGIVLALFLMSTNQTTVVLGPKSGPVLHDDFLALELVAEGLDLPTSMRFLGDGTFLVL